MHAFIDRDVKFLVVGAYALAIHGHPRATGDLDVWIECSTENARKAHSALAAFGAPIGDLTERDLSTPGVVFQVGIAPRRIDVLTQISGVEFLEAWPNRTDGTYAELRFPVIGRADLITNKRAAGRPKDLVDADVLTTPKKCG